MEPFLESLRSDGHRVAEVIARSDLDVPVRACPGWALRDLAEHLGSVHRWVIHAVEHVERPTGDIAPAPPDDRDALAQWVRDGVDRLVGVLAERAPDTPTWHPFAAPQVVGVWPRRQAHETMIHRWDAEDAVDDVRPLPQSLAADGVLEYFQLIVPRVVDRDGRVAPKGVLHIECVDAGMTCTITSGATVDVELGDGVVGASDAVIRGRAEDVLLALWKRRTLTEPGSIDGSSLAAEWLAFGGN